MDTPDWSYRYTETTLGDGKGLQKLETLDAAIDALGGHGGIEDESPAERA